MTRHTKLYKATFIDPTTKEEIEIKFRTLTILELAYLRNISNNLHKSEEAGRCSIIDPPKNLHFSVLQQIGDTAITKSEAIMNDPDLLTLTIDNLRTSVRKDNLLNLIIRVLEVLPSISIEYLLSLTYKDFLEIVCLCEILSNKVILNVQNSKDSPPVEEVGGKQFFADDGKSLKDKIKENQKFYNENK